MDLTAELTTSAPPASVFPWIEDLTRYPEWLGLVTRAEPVGDTGERPGAVDGAVLPAWSVDLRTRLGPLARAKRLRMVRTVHDPPTRVVFERCEVDGRDHSPWVLTASVASAGAGARLEMTLHYGGGLLGPVIERVLRDEIERSRPKLAALAEAAG